MSTVIEKEKTKKKKGNVPLGYITTTCTKLNSESLLTLPLAP